MRYRLVQIRERNGQECPVLPVQKIAAERLHEILLKGESSHLEWQRS